MGLPELEKLTQTVEALRHPESGCPWDLKQTHESLLKYLLEESYEFISSVEDKDFKEMENELGDVLLQVLLHSQLASEEKRFNLESVAKKLNEKLIRRHPHVFDNPNSDISTDEVIENWDKIKTKEKSQNKDHYESLITESNLNHPALYSAYKIGKKTNKISFDWDDPMQVAYKVEEEWQELKEELAPATPNFERVKEEMGDFLFSVAQLARHLNINPEESLRGANKKFIKRFQAMEKLIVSEKGSLDGMTQMEMDQYWYQAKSME